MMNKSFEQIRPFLLLATLGVVAGGLAKLADESALANQLGLNDLGTYLGLWIVIATIIAVTSETRWRAAVGGVLFFVGMVLAYYAVTRWLFGFWAWRPFFVWLVGAGTAVPLFTAAVWQSNQSGRPAALAAALPIGLLLWEAESLRLRLPLHLTQFLFDLVAATTLLLFFVRKTKHKRSMSLFIILIFIVAEIIGNLLPFL